MNRTFVMAQDCADLGPFLEDARYRRSWLLIKASHREPLDRALDLAKRCDDFITGISSEHDAGSGEVQGHITAVQAGEQRQASAEPSGTSGEPALTRTTRSSLSPTERERLVGRFAEGAKNRELAAELGLSPRQVQGIRMGCAREIRRRREKPEARNKTFDTETITASIDDVVRYLRQQDDVVVPQESGDFLVNARFRLSAAALLTRANRMRARQAKPEFALKDGSPLAPSTVVSASGHPTSSNVTPLSAASR